MSPRDLLLVLAICLAWAGNFLFSAYALLELPAFLYTALRMSIVALVLAPFLKPVRRAQWPRFLAVAVCMNVLHFGLSFWALRLAGELSAVAIVMQSYVPMSALLAWVVLGERFAWRTGTAIAASFIGVMVIGFDPSLIDKPAAMLAMLASAAFLALGTVLMRRLGGIGLVTQQGWSALIAIGPLLAISLAFEPGGLAALAEASPRAWIGVAYSALVASLLGHGVYFLLLQRHPVAQLTPWLLLTPLLAVGLGIVFWGDEPGPQLWIGGALVLGGVAAIALRALAKARPLPPAREI
ncbi:MULTISPECIES: DMT family transporter [unclassified Luteimonas]|uniref:DMT family transporter n=1 Tax=unclassified Luteimonas TaxID=2629088 RepID=UPI0018F0A6B6|nr:MULTISPECIES: DMT family transporter [unclassified Luteimonas]MBJ6978854.1 DMT family transporter [Luteimonas sp. MC1895]MBJ6984895.1 DMT family transporter [Luteimonas sp. MC1750]QQO05579.1 DMT family transporter [Luteimonas sp. MC1750]